MGWASLGHRGSSARRRASQRRRRGREGGGDAALASGWTNLGVLGCGCGGEFKRELRVWERRIVRERSRVEI